MEKMFSTNISSFLKYILPLSGRISSPESHESFILYMGWLKIIYHKIITFLVLLYSFFFCFYSLLNLNMFKFKFLLFFLLLLWYFFFKL